MKSLVETILKNVNEATVTSGTIDDEDTASKYYVVSIKTRKFGEMQFSEDDKRSVLVTWANYGETSVKVDLLKRHVKSWIASVDEYDVSYKLADGLFLNADEGILSIIYDGEEEQIPLSDAKKFLAAISKF